MKFSSMSLSFKLIAGFALVAVITAFTGAIGLWGVHTLSENVNEIGVVRLPSVQGLMMMSAGQGTAAMAMRTLTISELSLDRKPRQYDRVKTSLAKAQEGLKIYEPLPQTAEEAKLWEQFKPLWEKWKAELDKALTMSRQIDDMKLEDAMEVKWIVRSRLVEHYEWLRQLDEAVIKKEEFKGQIDPTQCNFGKWLGSYKAENPDLLKALKDIEEPHKKLHEMGHTINEAIKRGDMETAQRLLGEVKNLVIVVKDHMQKIHDIADNVDKLTADMREHVLGPVAATFNESDKLLDKIVKLNVDIASDSVKTGAADAAMAQLASIGSVIIGAALALALGLLLSRAISKPILRIVDEMREGSNQVADASGQISGSSQSLAEGATEQASSLEETSSALEEMASMTRQNADNANAASSIAREARGEAEKGNKAMGDMIAAMKAINSSSQEISKIIKVIEEIAFQTNLLALNAAVEAARAGEHGKGFAVVAEEVRNLAQRSATAAKDTSALIEDAVKKAADGGELADRAGQVLASIVESVKKVTDLVAEISAASNEQAQGVDQVNTAVAQMDKVTQQNAANAEETAAASEELSAQAEKLNEIVNDLTRIVQGTNVKIAASAHHAPAGKKHVVKATLRTLPAHTPMRAKPAPIHHSPNPKPEGKKADDLIPMDDDFGDF